jgi:hypothetical protein
MDLALDIALLAFISSMALGLLALTATLIKDTFF